MISPSLTRALNLLYSKTREAWLSLEDSTHLSSPTDAYRAGLERGFAAGVTATISALEKDPITHPSVN